MKNLQDLFDSEGNWIGVEESAEFTRAQFETLQRRVLLETYEPLNFGAVGTRKSCLKPWILRAMKLPIEE